MAASRSERVYSPSSKPKAEILKGSPPPYPSRTVNAPEQRLRPLVFTPWFIFPFLLTLAKTVVPAAISLFRSPLGKAVVQTVATVATNPSPRARVTADPLADEFEDEEEEELEEEEEE